MTVKDINLKDIGFKILMAFMVICPIYYNNEKYFGRETLRIGQEQFFQVGATILFSIVLLENIYLSLFLIWSIFLYAASGFQNVGSNYVMNLFWACILYQIAYKLVNLRNIDKVFNLLSWMILANIVWMILQTLRLDPIFMDFSTKGFTYDLVGLMGLKAFMGIFFALCIPILARRNLFISLLLFIPIYFSQCSVAMVGGTIAFLFHLWHEITKKQFIVAVMILSLVSGLYVWKDSKMNMMSDRASLWEISLRDAFTHPIMGFGLDSFRTLNPEKTWMYFKDLPTSKAVKLIYHPDTKSFVPLKDYKVTLRKDNSAMIDPWDNPHNEYVQLFYEFGAIGVILFICLCTDMVKRFQRSSEVIALAGFFISLFIISIGQFPFHVARIGFLICIMLGIYFKLTDEYKQMETNVYVLAKESNQ